MLEVKLKNKTIVIAAFPGMGKTFYKNNCNGFIVSDSDSSQFSWTIDEEGNKIRNPEFPNNYIEHIKSLIGKVDFIFVSTHEPVLRALIENNIYFFLLYPPMDNKPIMIERYYERGSDNKLIKTIYDNYDKWITTLEMDTDFNDITKCANVCEAQYISGFIKTYILDEKGNIGSNDYIFNNLQYLCKK